MNNENKLLNSIHKIFRNDNYIKSLFKVEGKELDNLIVKADSLKNEFLFSTMSEEMIKEYEKLLNYKTSNLNIENKRKEIETRWKTSGKCDLNLLQGIVDAWRPGVIKLEFINRNIQINYSSNSNIDYDVINIINSINEVKPAHLGINFIYKELSQGKQCLNCFNSIEIEEDFI